MPYALIIGLVVGKLAFIIGAIGKDPFALLDRVLFPGADEFHSSLTVSICALAFFLAEHPPTRVDVLVGIYVSSLSVLYSVLQLSYHYYSCTVVFAFILVCQLSNTVLVVIFKVTFVTVTIDVYVLSFALSNSIHVVSIILIAIWILSKTFPCVFSRGASSLSSFRSELIWSTTLLFSHGLNSRNELSYKL
jgi:hypothetical protein